MGLKQVWKLCEVVNVRVTVGHRAAQAQEGPAGWGRFSRFCRRLQEFFCKMESKFLNSRVLAVGFVLGCAKRFWFKYVYIKK